MDSGISLYRSASSSRLKTLNHNGVMIPPPAVIMAHCNADPAPINVTTDPDTTPPPQGRVDALMERAARWYVERQQRKG